MTTQPVEPIASVAPSDPRGAPAHSEGAPLSEADMARAEGIAAAVNALPGQLTEAPFDTDPESPMFQLLVAIARAERALIGSDDYEVWAPRLLAALGDGVRAYLPWLWAALHPGTTPWKVAHEAALRQAPRFLADLRAIAAKTGARCDHAVDVRRLESLERHMRGEPDHEPRHVRIEFPVEVLDCPLAEQVEWVRGRYAALTGGAPDEKPPWLRFDHSEAAFAVDAARDLFDRPLYRLMEETAADGRAFLPPAYWTLVAIGAYRAPAQAVVAEALTQLGAALRDGIPLDLRAPGGRSAALESEGHEHHRGPGETKGEPRR